MSNCKYHYHQLLLKHIKKFEKSSKKSNKRYWKIYENVLVVSFRFAHILLEKLWNIPVELQNTFFSGIFVLCSKMSLIWKIGKKGCVIIPCYFPKSAKCLSFLTKIKSISSQFSSKNCRNTNRSKGQRKWPTNLETWFWKAWRLHTL